MRKETAAPRWGILYERQDATKIAIVQLVRDSLEFRWTPEAANTSAAKYLCNAVLCVASGEQTACVALRQASSIPAFPAAIGQGISRHRLPLDLSPSHSDVFVEFLAPPKGLTVPMKSAVMPAAGGELWLGLEARRKSLFLIQVKSQLRRRQALELVPYSRFVVGEKPRPLTPAAIRKLQQELLLTKQSILAGKASLRSMKRGKGKSAAKAQLRKLEAHAKKLSEFAEAFDAANEVELRFRVFLRLKDTEVDLVHVGEVTDGS
jgi:hypothetical protein